MLTHTFRVTQLFITAYNPISSINKSIWLDYIIKQRNIQQILCWGGSYFPNKDLLFYLMQDSEQVTQFQQTSNLKQWMHEHCVCKHETPLPHHQHHQDYHDYFSWYNNTKFLLHHQSWWWWVTGHWSMGWHWSTSVRLFFICWVMFSNADNKWFILYHWWLILS